MKKNVLLIIFFVVAGIRVNAQSAQTPSSQPAQPQSRTTVKGGLGPTYVEHHTVTRTHWHTRGGVRYREVDPDERSNKKKGKTGGTTTVPANQPNNSERR